MMTPLRSIPCCRRTTMFAPGPASYVFRVWLVAGLFACPLWAQDDPFGDSPAEAPKPAAAGRPATPAIDAAESDHAVVKAIREVGPKTPLEWMMAARAVAQVEAYAEARRYLKMVLSAGLDNDAYAELVDRFGTAHFLEMRLDEKLQPEGAQLAEAVHAAVKQHWSDPERVRGLLEAALTASPRARLNKISQLRGGGDLPAIVLVQWLADDARRSDAQKLIRVWNPTAEEPLGQALVAFWALRLDAIETLPETRIRQVTPLLLSAAATDADTPARQTARGVLQKVLGRIPTHKEVREHLWAEIRSHLREARKIRRETPMARTTVWAWKTDLSQIEPRDVWRDEWETLQAGRAAVALSNIDPNDILAKQLLHLMEFQLHYGGTDPEHGIAISSIEIQEEDAALQEVEDLETLLDLALRGELSGASVHVCQKMALVGHQDLLDGHGGVASRLVGTILHPDRNIRFAATQTVAKLALGRGPFPGAGTLTDSLQFFMTSHGEARLLIGAARSDVAAEYAATARILGFTAEFARSGRELVKQLYQDADFSAVLIDESITDPSLKETVQQIRKSPRGRGAVILVMARGDHFAELEEFFRLEPRTVVRISVPEPEALAEDMRQLLAQAGRWRTLPAERLAQARETMMLTLDLLQDPVTSKYIDATRFEAAATRALFSEELNLAAAKLLTYIGTDSAQRALVEFALRRGEVEKDRKATLVAAADHLKQFGLLLTTRQLDTIFQATRGHERDELASVMLSLLRSASSGKRTTATTVPEAAASSEDAG